MRVSGKRSQRPGCAIRVSFSLKLPVLIVLRHGGIFRLEVQWLTKIKEIDRMVGDLYRVHVQLSRIEQIEKSQLTGALGRKMKLDARKASRAPRLTKHLLGLRALPGKPE